MRVDLSGYEGDKIKKKVTISSLEGQPLEITDIKSDIKDKIDYKLKTVEKGEKYSLEIRNRSRQEGKFRGKIELKTNSEKKPVLVIGVYCNLRKTVSIGTKSISFGIIDTARENYGVMNFRKTVRVRGAGENGFTIKKVKTSKDWIMTETRTQKENRQYDIVITLDKDTLPKGSFEEKIKIRTNHKRDYLEVDVKGNVI